MNRTAAVSLLVLCGAGGAFVHHLTESGGQKRTSVSQVANKVSAPEEVAARRKEIVRLADELPVIVGNGKSVDWIALDERLSALKPNEFVPLLRELTSRKNRPPDLWRALVEYAAEADPKGLLSFAVGQETYQDLNAVAGLCFLRIPDEVIAAILQYEKKPEAKGKDDANKLENLWSLAFYRVCERQPEQALAIAGRNGILDRKPLLRWLEKAVQTWTARDVDAAIQFLERYPEALKPALDTWSGKDRAAALAWLKAKPERVELIFGKSEFPGVPDQLSGDGALSSEFAVQTKVGELANRPVAESIAWVNTLSAELRKEALPLLLGRVDNRHPDDAAALCPKFPEALATPEAQNFVRTWSLTDPASASQFLQSAEIPADHRDRLVPMAVDSWLKNDRAGALNYIDKQTAGELKGLLLLDASQIVRDGDAEAVRDFVMSLPDLAMRTGAARRFLEPDSRQFAASAIKPPPDWITTIPDAELRTILLTPKPAPPPEKSSSTKDDPATSEDPFASPDHKPGAPR
ncbi:MAG TPA: hypothetical protein VG796_26945 [Verrucomicrobiales bacterium]|nr:hypothetical protein [Verrucomicrobiales bacterium]